MQPRVWLRVGMALLLIGLTKISMTKSYLAPPSVLKSPPRMGALKNKNIPTLCGFFGAIFGLVLCTVQHQLSLKTYLTLSLGSGRTYPHVLQRPVAGKGLMRTK
jgi:hypothetical protein